MRVASIFSVLTAMPIAEKQLAYVTSTRIMRVANQQDITGGAVA
jgi:hypothetical protein